MIEFGYVKIISGQASGRIGRFIGWDENGVKAKVAFGYETDILPYTNYHFYSVNSISNNISKQDLLDRYFELVQDLQAIDLRAHHKIKKYTAEHTSVITECSLIRHLLQVFFDFKNLTLKNKEKNIVIISSMIDTLWLNEFAFDLEMRGFHVGIINHEVVRADLDEDLHFAMDISDHYIFVEEYNKLEYKYINKNITSIYQSVTVIVDDPLDEDMETGHLYFGEPFTESFEQSLKKLINRIESPEVYTQI